MEQTSGTRCEHCGSTGADSLSVPFWIVLSGVGVGAAWALVGVAVGYSISRRR